MGRDDVAASVIKFEVARGYAVLGRREEALKTMRESLQGWSFMSPNELRADPFLSRLKTDPRFEEILTAARPL